MSKGSKDYVMLKQGTYTSLLITLLNIQLIFNLKKVLESQDLGMMEDTPCWGGVGVCRGRQGSPDDEAEHHRDPL